jgi:transcription initiation factor TFIID subunit TAF12
LYWGHSQPSPAPKDRSTDQQPKQQQQQQQQQQLSQGQFTHQEQYDGSTVPGEIVVVHVL